jgi:hypothetical protein
MNTPHPYENQHKMYAYKNIDGTFSLHGKTFHSKERIKELGGKWDAEKRHWNISENALLELKPLLMIKVRLAAHCHEDEEIRFVTHKEVACGFAREGCSRCDTPATCGQDVAILEVLDKDSQLLAEKYECLDSNNKYETLLNKTLINIKKSETDEIIKDVAINDILSKKTEIISAFREADEMKSKIKNNPEQIESILKSYGFK